MKHQVKVRVFLNIKYVLERAFLNKIFFTFSLFFSSSSLAVMIEAEIVATMMKDTLVFSITMEVSNYGSVRRDNPHLILELQKY